MTPPSESTPDEVLEEWAEQAATDEEVVESEPEGWESLFAEEEQIIVGSGLGTGWSEPEFDLDADGDILEEEDTPSVAPVPPGGPDVTTELADAHGFTIWSHLFEPDFEIPPQEWWLPGILPKGGSIVSVLAEPKVGKSLLLFDWCYTVATGRPWLDLEHEQAPTGVLYLDYELTRIQALWYLTSVGPDESDLPYLVKNFHHQAPPGVATERGFAELRPLDGQRKIADGAVMSAGEFDLRKVWEAAGKPSLVVLDTMSLTLEGSENDAEVLARWYRSVAWLKREGVTLVRVDHLGKDAARGARGSSAKAGQVDLQWTLFSGRPKEPLGEVVPDKDRRGWVTMRSSYDRTGEALSELVLLKAQRGADAPLWSRANDAPPANNEVEDLVRELDKLGVPVTAGKGSIRAHWSQVKASNGALLEAQNLRRSREKFEERK